MRYRENKMKFEKEINGMSVVAEYSDESVARIFIPLLQNLSELYHQKGSRVLVMLAAPPAAGKSTMAAFLEELFHRDDFVPVQAIGMDGFHRYQEYLLCHTLTRDGMEIPMVDVKGCPETFDLPKLTEAVKKIAAGECIGWPSYNRMLHNPEEDALTVDGEIVLLEGNYLLLDFPGRADLKQYADLTIRVTAEENDLRERLISRKHKSGTAYEKAVKFVEHSDLYNARICEKHSSVADITLRITHSGEYVLG